MAHPDGRVHIGYWGESGSSGNPTGGMVALENQLNALPGVTLAFDHWRGRGQMGKLDMNWNALSPSRETFLVEQSNSYGYNYVVSTLHRGASLSTDPYMDYAANVQQTFPCSFLDVSLGYFDEVLLRQFTDPFFISMWTSLSSQGILHNPFELDSECNIHTGMGRSQPNCGRVSTTDTVTPNPHPVGFAADEYRLYHNYFHDVMIGAIPFASLGGFNPNPVPADVFDCAATLTRNTFDRNFDRTTKTWTNPAFNPGEVWERWIDFPGLELPGVDAYDDAQAPFRREPELMFESTIAACKQLGKKAVVAETATQQVQPSEIGSISQGGTVVTDDWDIDWYTLFFDYMIAEHDTFHTVVFTDGFGHVIGGTADRIQAFADGWRKLKAFEAGTTPTTQRAYRGGIGYTGH